MSLKFLKRKIFYIPLIIVVLAGLLWYRQYSKSHQPVQYDTIKVQKGDLIQTVEATGKIESVDGVGLHFETVGTLASIKVKVGDNVKAGDTLANLKMADLNAAVAQASANLNQKLAGATQQDISYYQALVDGAKASLDQAKIDAQSTIDNAQSALDTARNNVQMAEGGENSRIVNDSYNDGVAISQSSLGILDSALTQADNILGIDNTWANQDFKTALASSDPNKLYLAQNNYSAAKGALTLAKTTVTALNALSQHADIDNGLVLLQDALTKSNQLLGSVSDVLYATLPIGSLTQATLDAKKTNINSSRTSVTGQLTAVINQIQAIQTAKTSYSTYSIAFEKAQHDYDNAVAAAGNMIKIKQAAYDQAQANLQSKVVRPREVDVAYYRAVLAQAVANRDKAVLKAPIDGVITKINTKVGESVAGQLGSVAQPVIEMLSPHFEIKVDIPETDVAKVQLEDKAEITLDAFGDDVKFSGQVQNIEPGSTEIQDVVYYKVTVRLDEMAGMQVMSGMTANVTLSTDKREGVLYVPLRAVRTNSEKYMKVLQGGKVTDMPVKLGMRADDGKVEVLSGVNEGDEIVLGVKE
jgi:HlyD family secretion protein